MATTSKTYFTSPRWLKVFFDIWENRSRTILVVASIAVGVFAVGMIITAYSILSNDMQVGYSAVNPANISIVTDPFDQDFVESVARIEGVKQAEGRHRTTMRMSQDNGASWRGLTVFAVDDFAETEIFERVAIEGTNTPDDKQILVESRIAESLGISLGDELLIRLPSGLERTVPVVGFVRDQAVSDGPNAPTVVFVTMDTLNWLGQPSRFNQLLVTVEGDGNDQAHIDAISAAVEDRVERNNGTLYSSTTNKTSEHPASNTVLAILTVMGAMGGLMLLLGSSLIANTLTALINQQLRQIGVMKLVGARSLQIVGMYLILIISLSLISLAVSIPLGAFGGHRFAVFFGGIVGLEIGPLRFVPQAIIVQTIVAVLVPILAGILPVIRGSRLTVEEAISDGDETDTKKRFAWLDRIGESLDWISRPLLVSIRNTFRNPSRLSLTLFTLTMAGAIFISVFNMQASLQGFIGSVSQLFLADVTIDMAQTYRDTEISAFVEDVPGVVQTEAWISGVGEVAQDDGNDVVFALSGIPESSPMTNPVLKAGRFLKPGDTNAIAVAETVWDEFPDLLPGDVIAMSVDEGREQAWTVVGIYAFPGRDVDTIFAYVPYDRLAPLTNQTGRATTLKVLTDTHTIEAQREMANTLDATLKDQGIQLRNVEAGLTTVEGISEGVSTLVTLFLGMAVLTAIVGSIGLAGMMSMNVMERIREIGILRAIGAVDSAVMQSVLIEGIFIGVLSWFFGIILSFPISSALLTMVSLALTNSVMPLKFSATGFWLWFVVILVLSAVASILPARNASRLTIREVLAYE